MNKILYLTSILIIILGFSVLLYWLIFPTKIVSFPKTDNLEVFTKDVKLGSNLKYVVNYCKHINTTSTVYRTLIGEETGTSSGKIIFTLSTIQRSVPKGCKRIIFTDVFISKDVSPGRYYLAITIEYRPNPFKTLQYFLTTEKFNIVK